jgi:hypothetical protein
LTFDDAAKRYKAHRSGFKLVGSERGDEVKFEVNGQVFFVNFVPEEGRWYCYAPTATGIQRIPVSMDGAPFVSFTVPMDEEAKEVVN